MLETLHHLKELHEDMEARLIEAGLAKELAHTLAEELLLLVTQSPVAKDEHRRDYGSLG